MRWLVRVAGSLVVLALVAVVTLFLFPTEKVAQLAAGEFRKMTGRDLSFQGAVRPTIWPHLGIRTGAVSLANAEWSDEGPMLTAQSLSIAVDLAALIGGTVRVTGIEMGSPSLLLERAKDGRVNWDLDAPAAPGSATEDAVAGAAAPVETSTPFTIDRAVIDAGAVRYVDHATGQQVALADLDLDVTIPDFEGAADLTASAVINGQPFSVTATVATFAPFVAGKVVPVVARGKIGGSEAAFDGRLGLSPLAADGAVDATLGDLPALAALLAQPAPDLPEGLGRNSIAMAGAATLTPEGSLHLRDGIVTLDDTVLTGAFDLVPGEDRPKLTAQLTAGALNLAALAGGSAGAGGGGGGSAPVASGWPTDTLDASALGLVDAALSLAADSVNLGAVSFGRTRIGVTVDAARAVVDLRDVAAYGGTLAGQVVVNTRKGLSARADLSLRGLALEPLLTQLAGYDRVTGTGDLRFNLLGSGSSVDALMNSLSGEGSLAFRNGEVRGLDLAGMIRTLDAGFVGDGSKTVFNSITGAFTVADGVLSNSDLVLAAPLVTASGAGTVDIGGQLLDYRITPLTLGGRALDTDVQVPVLVTGPWAAPSIRMDLASLAERRFKEERAMLEERAKAEIAQKLLEETGVVQLDGESIEDTARRAAEQVLQDEATRALERLLGGGGGD